MMARVASTMLETMDQRGRAPIRRTYLFNVITIKSPRSGPQYMASCSPPQSNIFSRATIERKQTGRRLCEPRRDGKDHYIRAKVRPCAHSWKWETQARGMKTSKAFSPTLREVSTVFRHVPELDVKRRLTGREDNCICALPPADPPPVPPQQSTPETVVKRTGGALSSSAR